MKQNPKTYHIPLLLALTWLVATLGGCGLLDGGYTLQIDDDQAVHVAVKDGYTWEMTLDEAEGQLVFTQDTDTVYAVFQEIPDSRFADVQVATGYEEAALPDGTPVYYYQRTPGEYSLLLRVADSDLFLCLFSQEDRSRLLDVAKGLAVTEE